MSEQSLTPSPNEKRRPIRAGKQEMGPHQKVAAVNSESGVFECDLIVTRLRFVVARQITFIPNGEAGATMGHDADPLKATGPAAKRAGSRAGGKQEDQSRAYSPRFYPKFR